MARQFLLASPGLSSSSRLTARLWSASGTIFQRRNPWNRHGKASLNTTSSLRSSATEIESSIADERAAPFTEPIVLKNSGELADFIIERCLTVEKGDIYAGLNFLKPKLLEIRDNPPTRMLTLSRLSLKSPDVFKWFVNWLWPHLNGMKPSSEAFPIVLDPIFLANQEDRAETLRKRMHDALTVIDDERDLLLPPTVWAGRRVKKVDFEPDVNNPLGFVTELPNKMPLTTMEGICNLLESFHRQEVNQYFLTSKLKKLSTMHAYALLPLFHSVNFESDQYLLRYLQISDKKRQDMRRDVISCVDTLFERLDVDAEVKAKLDMQTRDDVRLEAKRKRENKVIEEKRKFGTKHQLFVTLRVERNEDEDDFGVDAEMWKAARQNPIEPGVIMAGPTCENNFEINVNSDQFVSSDGSNESDDDDMTTMDLEEEGMYNSPYAEEQERTFFEDSCSSHRKIFIENVPDNVDEHDIGNVLRNCGEVKRVWLYRSEAEDDQIIFGRTGARGKHYEDTFAKEYRGIRHQEITPEQFAPQRKNWIVARREAAEAAEKAEALALEGITDNSDWKSLAKDEKEILSDVMNRDNSDADDDGDDLNHDHDGDFDINVNDDISLPDTNDMTQMVEDGEVMYTSSFGAARDNEIDTNKPVVAAQTEPDLYAVRNDIMKAQKSKEMKKYKRKAASLKKRVARTHRNYSYAYVEMSDDYGYNRVTRDEMRIFGVCIDGFSCRIQEAARLRTLIIEFSKPMTCEESRARLSAILGPWHSLNLPQLSSNRANSNRQISWSDVASKKPVFIHLEFPSHEEAWKSHDVISRAILEQDAPLKVNWVKSRLYWRVACKAKEMNIETRSEKKNKEFGIDLKEVKTLAEARKEAKEVGNTTLEEELESFAYGSDSL